MLSSHVLSVELIALLVGLVVAGDFWYSSARCSRQDYEMFQDIFPHVFHRGLFADIFSFDRGFSSESVKPSSRNFFLIRAPNRFDSSPNKKSVT